MSLTPRAARDESGRRLALLILAMSFALMLAPAALRGNTAQGKRAMVVTGHPLATDAGVKVLQEGGNAVDAAVAAALMLGVVDSHNSGIGGGCFILIRTAAGESIAIDGRETAPAGASRDMYIRDGKPQTQLSQTGPLASGVPGALAAYEHAARHFGSKPFAALVLPAADVAEEGFHIDGAFARRLAEETETIKGFAETARVLLKADATPYQAGEVLRQPDLAKTYRSLAEHGTAWFYRGPFAQRTGQWMRENGGILTADDFAAYQVVRREALQTTYRDHTIVGFAPPSSGGVHVAQILNILEHLPAVADPQASPADRLHAIVEAMKLAFADRAHWLGDPDFAKVPRGLIDREYARELAAKVSGDAVQQFTHGTPPRAEQDLFKKHTTHIAAADDQGNWVAITTTVNTAFGAKVIIPGTGVLLNNEMDDFSIQPGQANYFGLVGSEANAIAPGKRPLSSMSPTIVLKDGDPVLTLGAAGGPTIISQVVLVLSNLIDLNDELPAAMDRPRVHHQWSPDVLRIENTVSEEIREELKRRGYQLNVVRPQGATNAIQRQHDGTFIGVSEPRQQGKAAGVD